MVYLLEGFSCPPQFLLSAFFFIPDLWQLREFSWEREMSVCMHVVRSWGIAVVPACCVENAGQFGFNLDHPCLVVSTWGCGPKQVPAHLFSHQLFHPTWPKASELQVFLKLRFLFPRVTSNSRDSLGANATLLIYGAGCTSHISQCLYLWVQRETLAVLAALCLLLLLSFQLKFVPQFQVLLGVGRICEAQEGKSVIEWFGRGP